MPRVITKKSAVASKVPLSTDLEIGELAVNVTDRKLFTKNASNQVIALAEPSVPVTSNPWDYWTEQYFTSTTAADATFVGTATSSGTNNTGIPTAALDGVWVNGVFLRSSATANSGYRYMGSSVVGNYFSTIPQKFRCVWKPLTAHTNWTIRLGYLDTTSQADAVDGAYFEIINGVAVAKTSSNSVRTTSGTTLTLTLAKAYIFEIEATSTSVSFTIEDGVTGAVVYSQTISTNIPNTTARVFGVGFVANNSGTTAVDGGILYYMGYGTLNMYNILNGSTKGPMGDPGITVSSTAPSSPVLNQLWLQV